MGKILAEGSHTFVLFCVVMCVPLWVTVLEAQKTCNPNINKKAVAPFYSTTNLYPQKAKFVYNSSQ